MAFKDYLESDMMNTFFTDFAEIHTVNNVEMVIVIDEDLVKERLSKIKSDIDGIYIADVLFHVRKSVYGEKPAIGEILNLDGDIYRVSDAQEDKGMYSISLVANDS